MTGTIYFLVCSVVLSLTLSCVRNPGFLGNFMIPLTGCGDHSV